MTKPKKHKQIDGVEYKWCNDCKTWKPVSEFSNLSRSWDSLQYRCKSCHNDRNRQHDIKNPEYRNSITKDITIKRVEFKQSLKT